MLKTDQPGATVLSDGNFAGITDQFGPGVNGRVSALVLPSHLSRGLAHFGPSANRKN